MSDKSMKAAEAMKKMFETPVQAWSEYMTDALQRSVLYLDVMRERGNQYREHLAKAVPHVLSYEFRTCHGRTKLCRAPSITCWRASCRLRDVKIDPRRRPFVIVDPRAGHGPGIGGFKADSEVGVALKAGHACYFCRLSARA